MKKLIVLFFVLLVKFNFSQNSGKTHFIIHPIDKSIEISLYERAASNWTQLDKYRLMDKRRVIYFSDMKASIELYSAQELLDTYGKQISPFTIKTETYPDLTFDVSKDGSALKPQFK